MRTFTIDDLTPSQIQALATIRRHVLNDGRNWVDRSNVHWGSAHALQDRGIVTINGYRGVVRLTERGEELAEEALLWIEEGIWLGDTP